MNTSQVKDYIHTVEVPDSFDAFLAFVSEQLELLPDRPEHGNTRIWTETIDLLYAVTREVQDQRRGNA